MSRKQSFEEALRQKMSGLPLPDENESWQKMEELLDEKKKRRAFLFFRNEKAIGGAMLLLLLSLWLCISPEKTNKPLADVATPYHQTIQQQNGKMKDDNELVTDESVMEHKTGEQQNDSLLTSSSKQVIQKDTLSSSEAAFLFTKNKDSRTANKLISRTYNSTFSNKNGTSNSALSDHADQSSIDKKDKTSIAILQNAAGQNQSLNITQESTQSLADVNQESSSATIKNGDSSNESLVKKDSLQQTNKSVETTASKAAIIVKKHNPFFVDAGIGITQQAPVGGQKLTSYNYNGNHSVLSDYIPYAFIKLEKDKRWFVQGEFHYAAPRLIKPFSYYQTSKADYNHSNTNVAIYRLQKTWYTQLPLSFNVYVRSSWSLGAGIVYNMLRGAVADKETAETDALSGKQTIVTEPLPVKGFTDSFLYKANTGLLLQTDYTKNRWSFSLRYMQDVQPYLTYTLPNGERKDKHNTSLELMIRYRLFRSKTFRLVKY